MVNSSVLKHLLSDNESLSCYKAAQIVSFVDIKRRMHLLARRENSDLPDHFYRLAIERDFKDLFSLDQLFSKGLSGLAKEHLTLNGFAIHVKTFKQNEWQQLITYLPPLLLKMAFLHEELPPSGYDIHTLKTYFDTTILPNARYTALASPLIPELENLVASQQGFYDLHVHLNGSTETDLAWQEFLSHPDKIYKHFKNAFSEPKVKEQLEQESHLLDPLEFYGLLRIARRLRYVFYDYLFGSTTGSKFSSLDSLLRKIIFHDRYSFQFSSHVHPFKAIIDPREDLSNLLAVEGLMYLLIFRELSTNRRPAVTSLFHFYLLILGLANRLLVQQTHQYGFEQFQKHTLNNLRELSEQQYHQRFFQMHGNELRQLNFLEGRFSPKTTEAENRTIVSAISVGWRKFINSLNNSNIGNPELRLIAHFIKRPDRKPYSFIRHKQLRIQTWQRAKVLGLLVKGYKTYRDLITGVDAAASEFDTPPEVFAPSFRMLRRKNAFKHFTYHVGEDFFHLISGLRAIHEAVHFIDLRNNDRIGHATATGISADLWLEAVGKTLLIRKGEWLDNLIFVYHLTITRKLTLSTNLNELEAKIIILTKEIYGSSLNPNISELITAWQFRKYCPIMTFSSSRNEASKHFVFDLDEWNEIQNAGLSLISKTLLRAYHEKETRNRYDEILSLNVHELFTKNDLQILQEDILAELAQKEIVIETLPTSNVRIGHYQDYKDYHLHNWVKLQQNGVAVPKIVVGTDDTGIFATNIFNEYANIFCYLIYTKKQTPSQALSLIRALDNNGHNFSFK